ncbi:MAG: sigma-70 family RNA polymerase sigma factor [Candidatus Kerfeldbacteria bacterium]|nr:sigma-70 family RNA polymerase sigma factor [Candidatus Kerfeldbacteria bacterium]
MDKSAKVLAQARKGVPAALTELYETNIREVYRFIYYKVGNKEDAEDLAQDVFIAAFAGLKKFRGEASFRNWCYEIAKRKIADLWREKYGMPTVDIEAVLGIHTTIETAEMQAEAAEQDTVKMTAVEQVLGQLKDNYREILEYRFLKNYSIKETADAMGISVSNAKVLQHRALKKAATLESSPLLITPTTSSPL